ncbi:hypothetical protein EIN_225140 [Entamoeba invadens IP1]|uniref:CAAX prenyl protease 2/Lysostaphin resistance protein A-like domain-containing protein n=1 Tax=Entamoeba invadens IP1 TaxID=370355 RepID=A0A0A1U2C2_ENTIV|nr:hypothetical protein EIN_225140 [Entamoeba invadens IP1]ELP88221.1 hypothetical protein EIN_225140 [Entamoeba invadens IP1]|eukprot:XP_004254992.1 hypothetical protein EIN_225140 [Entamoeba invadens IP1]
MLEVLFGSDKALSYENVKCLTNFTPFFTFLLVQYLDGLYNKNSSFVFTDFTNLVIQYVPPVKLVWYPVALCIIPIVMIFGSFSFFIIFPEQCDLLLTASVGKQKALLEQNNVFLDEYRVRSDIYYNTFLNLLMSPLTHLAEGFAIESVFRGYIFLSLINSLHPRIACIITGAIFGFYSIALTILGEGFDVAYFGEPFTGMVCTFLVHFFLNGIFCFFALKTKSMLICGFLSSAWIALQKNYLPFVTTVFDQTSPFYGPSYHGIIPASPIILTSFVLFFYMGWEAESPFELK